MQFLYIDESGDSGMAENSSPFFILAGLAIDASYWKTFYHQIDSLRIQIRQRHGVDFGEFKGAELFEHKGTSYKLQLSPKETQRIYESLIELIFDTHIQRYIIVQSKPDLRRKHPTSNQNILQKELGQQVWQTLLSKFEQEMINSTQRTNQVTNGLIYMDGQPNKQINRVVRIAARKFDQEQSYPNVGIVESPVYLNSKDSTFIQLADILAYSVNRIHRDNRRSKAGIWINEHIRSQLQEECVYPK